ncbi:MarR family winged helix-turn-helix transcriptional regulator [Chitinophaga nivalis]|uniref:MarR family winged helix-turn-helix transcriptional regulator n=1 Tax=Chitinophaga nivalis TaxID=2991709 RepID=A0ABT3IM73_9BACT|nr:MarR family winged helix-turn-helix transcriptional regulator [Chitinophaga nivalis]MCW3465251.1 MarR family winged helix-turn-helix transcriptional regulator [Chitinophaga nivalis]MCW3485057.1 MarR family winged helix-turn-helix transcriptional regulator [Chitinophaga nivalis]
MADKSNPAFEAVYTEFQCLIMAEVNRLSIDGISATQYNMLDFIIRNGPCTTSMLAKGFHISPPAVSRHMKKLLEKKYVLQVRDKDDRRHYFHRITPKGMKLVKNATHLRKNMSANIQQALSKPDLITFTRLCRQIVDQIK